MSQPGFPDYPCRNPSCPSYGKPHPNCRCGPGLAHGGSIEPYCSQDRAHMEGCEFYAQGGQVNQVTPFQELKDDPSDVLGHAAIDHGLLGILNNVGKPKMVDPQQHVKVLSEARNQHEWRKQPKEMKLPRTMGHRLGDYISDGDHDKMADHIHGHPLVGLTGKTHLKPIMARMAEPITLAEPHPEAFRGSVEYLSSAIKGHEKLDSYMKKMIGDEKAPKLAPDKSRMALKERLDKLQENPISLLDVGGSVGHYLPAHGVQVAATSASAVNYLNSIKPKKSQGAPLDKPSSVSIAEEMTYDRQLDNAQQPLLIAQHVKNGTLNPQDVATVKTIYPGLYNSMVMKAGEQLIAVKAKKKEIPYHQRQSLSLLLGQPLDSTLTTDSMMAIMHSSVGQQAKQQSEKAGKKASSVELKQIDKMNSLYKTDLQDLAIDKRK